MTPDRAVRTAHAAKREAVLRAATEAGADAVLLTSHTALSWYLEGARVGVSRAAGPVCAVRVDRDGDRLLVLENERERLLAEELAIDVDVEGIPWHGDLVAAGGDALPEAAVARALRDARRSLHPHEVAAYRSLGADAARAVTDAVADARATTTERELAGRLAGAIEATGSDPLVVLVGGTSRSGHRHPLPTDAPLGRRALVVVCARRAGLVASLSRWVGEEPTAAELDLEERIAAVEADAFAATMPDAPLSEVLAAIARAYPRHGFDVDEWTRHHQGGPAGYAGRDPRATPATDDRVALDQPFAWNPTAPAAKIEDTVLLTASGIEVLTVDPRWPTRTVAGLRRPASGALRAP
jgi:Xaa-Pro aminopeptidase